MYNSALENTCETNMNVHMTAPQGDCSGNGLRRIRGWIVSADRDDLLKSRFHVDPAILRHRYSGTKRFR